MAVDHVCNMCGGNSATRDAWAVKDAGDVNPPQGAAKIPQSAESR